MDEVEAAVLEVKPFDLHGVRYHDVTITYPDRTVDNARVGPEAVPDGLQAGETVMATKVMNMVVSLRRP